MPKLAPIIRLSNGQSMPMVGLGTWRSYKQAAEEAVKYAIDLGYRHIDTAYVYENEQEVGRAIKAKIDEGIISRGDIFVVTKLAGIHHDPKLVKHACNKSLSNLGLDYIDLYLMHFPVAMKYCGDEHVHGDGELTDTDYLDTWKAMEELVDSGLVRGIGISNFNAAQTERVLQNCRIPPVVNQVECHPGFNQKKLLEFCQQKNIILTAYAPLGRPRPDIEWPPFLFDQISLNMAKRYARTPIQICLRYLIQRGCVVIPKSTKKHHISENFDCFDFHLSDLDMKVMDEYHTGQRLIPFMALRSHRYFPFNTEF